MKITDDMRFPHPVLSKQTGDYPNAQFDVEIDLGDTGVKNQVSLGYTAEVTEEAVRALLVQGVAGIGLFVTCPETYFSDLMPISFPHGQLNFQPGDLVGRVSVRPMIWARKEVRDLPMPGLHPEFGQTVSFTKGDVVAIDDEWEFRIDPPNMPTFESIFVLVRADTLKPGQIEVDLEAEKITIRTSPQTYRRLSLLRGSEDGRTITLNSVYLPAIMDVLDYLRENPDGCADRRWKQPFICKCDSVGIKLETGSLFESAQRLLDFPAADLGKDMDED